MDKNQAFKCGRYFDNVGKVSFRSNLISSEIARLAQIKTFLIDLGFKFVFNKFRKQTCFSRQKSNTRNVYSLTNLGMNI